MTGNRADLPSEPRVSVIIPAYNCAATVRESVESLFRGNLSPGDEVVIVNDASTDNTAAVLAELAAAHPEIRVIAHPKNRGGGAARNTAVENAANPLIFCLDSDNLLRPNSLPSLREFFVSSGADVAVFGEIHYFQTDPASITHKRVMKPGIFTLQDHLAACQSPGASGNYLYSKESWVRAGGYPEFAGALDTWGFGFRQLATGSKMLIQAGSSYLHRYGHDSYWSREEKRGSTSLLAFQIVMPRLELIVDRDVAYMNSPKDRTVWFDRLDQRPIRLKGSTQSLVAPRARLILQNAKRRLRKMLQRVGLVTGK